MEKYFIFLEILKEIDANSKRKVVESRYFKLLLLLLKFDKEIMNFNFVQERNHTVVSTVSSFYSVQKAYQLLSVIS